MTNEQTDPGQKTLLISKGGTPIALEAMSLNSDEPEPAISNAEPSLRKVQPLGEGIVIGRPRSALESQTVDLGRPGERSDTTRRVPISIGRVLRDRYVIEAQLGSGGKGAVFRARDLFRASLPDAEQRVALKVLHLDDLSVEETADSLRHELHCAQTLSHSNIVNVYDQDRDEDVIFYTMELLDGELLSSVLERHRHIPMDREQARQMIRQIGAGLQHAHERGVVHGDLKPSNIFVTRDGELRILDFGAARNTRARLTATAEGARQSVTLAYASWELLQGRAADPRDDLYAFACISYELLTGEHPFSRRPATLVRDFGILPKRPGHLGGRRWRALQTNLSWHRAARSISAGVFARRVTRHVEGETRVTPLKELKSWIPPKPSWRPHAVALGVAAVLVTAAAIVQFRASSVRAASMATPPVAANLVAVTRPPAPAPVATEAASEPATDTPVAASAAEAVPVAAASPARRPALTLSVEGYQVRSGDRFVEIRVRRNRTDKDTSFAWWTEPATAQKGVDYVDQAKAIQTFANDRDSTRLYVKLIPDSQRPQRDYFYVAMTQPGGKSAGQVTRTPIWLPIPRGQMQAQR